MRRKNSKNLPPGSLGFPFIGHSLSFMHAMRTNDIEQWLQEQSRKYGPVSKLSLLAPFRKICGERNLTELTGDDHKSVRGAVVSFLKPEMLNQYFGKIDEELRNHLEMLWHGAQKVTVMPVMKTLTFNIMSSLLFGIEQEERRNDLVKLILRMMNALSSLPINLPFTQLNRSLKASAKIRTLIKDLINERRAVLEQRMVNPNKDLINCLLGMGKDPSIRMSDEEIVDNVIGVMITGHDTSSVLITFLVKLLGTDRSIYEKIVQEHEEIAKTKTLEDLLTWDDLAKMKYTWSVAMETLRMNPPLLGSFRKVLKEFEYEGYTTPKGRQVIWATNMTHMDERLFPDPSKFDPLRFEKQGPIPPYCFAAFGGGARIISGLALDRGSSITRTIPSQECRFQFSVTGC
ncbi:Binding,calmodulin binding, putative isoform 1 [Hibiscus syriacus]|uniref:Binding,calmodulin binding, putative isoform 1 n=1 Tax=Hibiscus syriacus TaxID=106335 RepID=A0A6A2X677_HIBSY|nr:Binding,calmodulin binding, putative isoform 1 [Hibiscus syriacus]